MAASEWGNFWRFNKLASTNDKARDLIQAGWAKEGHVIFTPHQTAGRGQRQTSWETYPDLNLTFSVVLFPENLKAEYQFYLNQVVTLGIIQVLQEIENDEQWLIKWPNDIYWQNRKLGGILIENALEGAYFQNVIVGVGLNINQRDFPAHLGNATSLSNICQREFSLEELLSRLVKGIETWYKKLQKEQFRVIRDAYEEWLYLKRQWHEFKTPKGEPFRARILGVESNGLLVLEKPSGQRLQVHFKEVQF